MGDTETVEEDTNVGSSVASIEIVDLSRQGSLNFAVEGVECQEHDHQQMQLNHHCLYL